MKAIALLISLCVVFSLALADALSTIHYHQPETIYVNQYGERLPSPQESNKLEAAAETNLPVKG